MNVTLYAHWQSTSSSTQDYWVCGYGVHGGTDSAGNIISVCGTCGARVGAIGAEHRIYIH